MKKQVLLSFALAGVLLAATVDAQTKPKPKAKPTTQSSSKTQKPMLKTKADQFSYAIGLNIAQGIKQQGLGDSISVAVLSQALNDVLKNQPLLLKSEEAQEIIQTYFAAQQSKAGDKNVEEGKKFLAENAKKPGIKITASGLQYEVIKEGTGAYPKDTNQVKVHYHGTLINGEVFDSSIERNQPATFGVNQVIKGWVEGLQLMKVGSEYKFYIPSELAYGSSGAGQKIGPNTALIFLVQLLAIEK
ncbi:MAG: FKBP-type peptidyl-prolyl cis-trans isomerase [Cytophagales bacterium]